ncbi:unnamed protein product [Clonostachys byssicola]|uniref:F-box domain-containing protein n=1 Tax=Clonostachys byssicola TaxID=160290 RepID=A0A9N9XZS5_9HYPO|nr:unnamed protein product [Clonostachys byssicola]
MPDTIFACIICGTFVYEEDTVPQGYPDAQPWLNRFRGIYQDREGIHLTGVSRNDENQRPEYTAPRDIHARWEDPEYDPQNDSVRFGAMTQRSVNGRYGFIFHESCWSLLEETFAPNEVPLQRLFDVCLSIPIAWDVMDWDHTYGGLHQQLDLTYSFPWEPRGMVLRNETYLEVHDPYQYFNLTGEATEHPPPTTLDGPSRQTQDPFLKLPLEILLKVAEEMDTSDVLRFRLISRSFWPIFNMQSFWLSRFRAGAERSWAQTALGPYQRD